MFYDGLGEAITYAESLNSDRIWITNEVNMPYIYVCFILDMLPINFLSSVDYINPDGAFRSVSAFGKYSFGSSVPDGTLCIVDASETEDMEVYGIFGNYAVVKS